MGRTNKRAGLPVVALVLLASSTRAAAPVGHYTVNEQAKTVLDNKTGLTWQREVPGAKYTWDDAGAYCQNLSLGGFSSGWRLPTVSELETLVDVRVASPGPTIDATAFPATPADKFWTSSVFADMSSYSLVVDFYGSETAYDFPDSEFHVRCVR